MLENNAKRAKLPKYFWRTNSWDEVLSKQLEKYICHLCGYQRSSVNEVRYKMFHSKHMNINHSKVVDLLLLPPCQQVLNLHSLRANCIAK